MSNNTIRDTRALPGLHFGEGGRGDSKFAYRLTFRPWKKNFIDRLMIFRIEEYIFWKIIKIYVHLVDIKFFNIDFVFQPIFGVVGGGGGEADA
jgi:hypothetical protein